MRTPPVTIIPEAVEARYQELFRDAEAAGYHLNPDKEFVLDLVRGLLVNESRYGYPSCPCRRATGDKALDLDIICPCDYRDQDLSEYGMCYCALYVTGDVLTGKRPVQSIPERRPPGGPQAKWKTQEEGFRSGETAGQESDTDKSGPKGQEVSTLPFTLSLPVWRCRVCGYLCAREAPPEVCPICKAKKERFERFL